AVGGGEPFGSDAQVGGVDEAEGGAEGAFAAAGLGAHVAGGAAAGGGEVGGEFEHPVEFEAVLAGAPGVVVDVLASARVIAPDDVDVAALVGADPDFGPGGWDDEGVDAVARVAGEGRAALVEVAEAAA